MTNKRYINSNKTYPTSTGYDYYFDNWITTDLCAYSNKWCPTTSYSILEETLDKIIDMLKETKIETNEEEKSKHNKENIMIKITDVQVKNEKRVIVDETKRNDKGNYVVTKVDVPVYTTVVFENGHSQTAHCDEDDEFNLEIGIGICVARELMYRMYGINDDDNIYNKIIRNGIKIYNKKCKLEEKRKAMIEATLKDIEAKKIKEQKHRIKKAEKKKEREIEIMAEAIRRANNDVSQSVKENIEA